MKALNHKNMAAMIYELVVCHLNSQLVLICEEKDPDQGYEILHHPSFALLITIITSMLS